MSEDEALAQLERILARPEFQTTDSLPWWQQLLVFVVDRLLDVWAQMYQAVSDAATGREGWIGLVMLAIGCLAMLAVVIYLARSIRLAVVRDARATAESAAERRERSDRLWQTAQQLAAAGDWPAAVRAAYLSALYALDEHALLHVQSGLTNREHANRLGREHPEIGGTFAELVQRYDRLRYGRFPITAEAYHELSGLVASARAASST